MSKCIYCNNTSVSSIHKVVITVCLPVCLFVCPIITQEPLDRFASKFELRFYFEWVDFIVKI